VAIEGAAAVSLSSRQGCAEHQINPSKSKQFQEKKLGFPWIPLADSGLFKGLRRIQIKKIFSGPPRCRDARCGPGAAIRKIIPQASDIGKTKHALRPDVSGSHRVISNSRAIKHRILSSCCQEIDYYR
jgi:hypothetical protein